MLQKYVFMNICQNKSTGLFIIILCIRCNILLMGGPKVQAWGKPQPVVYKAGCRGCKCTQKISFVDSLGKSPEIWEEFLKSGQNAWKSGLKRHPTFLTRKSGARRLQKNTRWPRSGSHTKKIFAIFVGKNLLAKCAQNLFGKVWGKSGKIHRIPKHSPPTRVAEPEPRSRPFSVETELLTKFSWSWSWWLI